MARAKSCECVREHRPRPRSLDVHHVVPASWNGPTTPANLVTLCPTTHRDVHVLLDEYVRLGGEPPWSTRRRFSHVACDLAAKAWAQRPANPTPTLLTVPH